MGLARLLLGDWSDWSGMERRLDLSDATLPRALAGKPMWAGEADLSKAVLVHWEQGLGDTVQFIRLIGRAAERVGRLIVVCQPALHALLSPAVADLDPRRRVVLLPDGDPLPNFDAWALLLSLPHLLGLTPEALRPARPYLKAVPDRAALWAGRLSEIEASSGIEGRPIRIGLVWQGNPNAPAERKRSFPLKAYAALADGPGVVFYPSRRGPAGTSWPTRRPACASSTSGRTSIPVRTLSWTRSPSPSRSTS